MNYGTVIRYLKVLPYLLRDQGISLKEMMAILNLRHPSEFDFLNTLKKYHGSAIVELAHNVYRLDDPTAYFQSAIKPLELTHEQRLALAFVLSVDMPYLPAEIRKEKRELLLSLGIMDQQGNGAATLMMDAAKLFTLSNLGKVEGDKTAPFFKDPTMLDDLLVAIDEHYVCSISYVNRDGASMDYDISPYRFFEKDGAPYILVSIGDQESFKCLRPSGLMRMDLTERKFGPVDEDEILEFIDSAFGTFYGRPLSVKIWFDGEIAPLISERQ